MTDLNPMPPPPTLQPFDPTRGIISCFTQDGVPDDHISPATDEALCDIILDHYEEAYRRLPVEDVPDGVDLAHLVHHGGICLGLLDPVTNIILNTLALLPDGFDTNPSPSSPPGPRRREEKSRESWRDRAWTSGECLVEFLRAYFGLLTQEQAGRYLIWARGDLAMAVLLVEHELYAARPTPPDPRAVRTRSSLRIAATKVSYPWPDYLVSLATAWLPQERLKMLVPVLRREGGGNRLTVHDVKTILYALRHQDDMSAMATMLQSPTVEESVGLVLERTPTTSCVDLGDGRIACTNTTVTIVQRTGDHIASLRRPQDIDSTLSSYSTQAASPAHDDLCASVRSPDADADGDGCPYVRSLEMSLHGTIHGFYLQALAMLPSYAARYHVRGVFVAGHCYGPLDPVSNIVLSAVWYDANFPLLDADRLTEAHDILDTRPMLRSVSRSLHGLVALLHAISGQKLPLHEILKYLCYTKCDLSVMLQPHLHQRRLDGSSPNPSPFAAAATAAKHPQPSAMAWFLTSLAPTKLDRIRFLMMSATANNGPLSHQTLTELYSILREETSAMIIPWLPRPPKLCRTALSILARKREAYANQQSLIRGHIERLLQDYAGGHPSEPKYDLDFVCGFAVAGHTHERYHINFMATTESTFKNTLFFADFAWVSYQDLSKPAICCPLSQPYDMGRCYYGHESARNIAYPDHTMEYFLSDITSGGLDDTEGELDIDFMYFDSKRDVELAKVLQKMAKKEEDMQRFSGRSAEWGLYRAQLGC